MQTAVSFWLKVILTLCGVNVSELIIFVSVSKRSVRTKEHQSLGFHGRE
jgi:hypothetical protein